MLCICSTGPQHSVTITSCSPTESTEASKNLLYRWISETVVIITLHLFAFFRRTQFIAFFARVWFLSLGELTALEDIFVKHGFSMTHFPPKHSGFPGVMNSSYLRDHLGRAQHPSWAALPTNVPSLQGWDETLGDNRDLRRGPGANRDKLQQRPGCRSKASRWRALSTH